MNGIIDEEKNEKMIKLLIHNKSILNFASGNWTSLVFFNYNLVAAKAHGNMGEKQVVVSSGCKHTQQTSCVIDPVLTKMVPPTNWSGGTIFVKYPWY